MSLRTFWKSRGLANRALLPLSAAFGLAVSVRRLCHERGLLGDAPVGAPVVVVGAITAGGGGKTPFTIALARQLKERGLRPGVVSRGHKGGAAGPLAVDPDTPARVCGDEPLLIRREANVPVWVGRDRPRAARALLARHPGTDIVISDDGLQHLALRRDLEIAVVDPGYGAGNGWLLPAGPLREPEGRLGQVDIVVGRPGDRATITAQAPRVRRLDAGRTEVPAGAIKGRVAAVAGIADPSRFFSDLERAGIDLASRHPFPDHHAYRRGDLAGIRADLVLMTPKDGVKCAEFADERCLEWNVTHVIDDRTVAKVAGLAREPKDP